METFKYRPSSHSNDYTIIATYRCEKDAEKAYAAIQRMLRKMKRNPYAYDVDWDPERVTVYVDGERIFFNIETSGDLDYIESAMREAAEPVEVAAYTDYQSLTIRVKVPAGITVESAMLILERDEAETIKRLREICGEPRVIMMGDSQVFEWTYEGDGIFNRFDGVLRLNGFEFSVVDHENWLVEDNY